MRLGIADDLGWAVAVTASRDHEVVDRRRIELVEAGVSPAPIHYESRRLEVATTIALVAKVRASVARASSRCTRRDRNHAAHAGPLDLAASLAARVPRRRRRPTSRAVAVRMLGERADEVLQGPRATLGPPWTKDHRIALAATIVAG
jgi:hypothetical protein